MKTLPWLPFRMVLSFPILLCLIIGIGTFGHPLAAQTDDSPSDVLLDTALRSPAVAIVLEMPRNTPVEVLSAVFILLDLDEQPVAAKLLEPLLKEELTEAEQAMLVEKFSTAKFLRLSRLENGPSALENSEEGIGIPGVRTFAQACLKAAADKTRDPARIAKLIQQLDDAKPEVRNAARVDLKASGIDGIRACIEALAKIDRDLTADHEDQRARLMAALVALHPEVDEPLLATLASCDSVEGHLCSDCAEVAGHLRMSSAVPWLAKLAACSTDSQTSIAAQQSLARMGISKPTPAEARALAVQGIERLEAGVSTVRTTASGKATWWSWHDPTGPLSDRTVPGKLDAREYPLSTIQTLAAERLARTLTSCGQPDPEQRQLALIYYWETLLFFGRATSWNMSDSYSARELSDTLAEAVKRVRITAAIHCAATLGRRGDRTVLISSHSRPAPLARSLKHADAGLRFSALEAIMQLSPDKSFAGSSQLADVLWDFAAGSGPAQAVVVSPIASRLSTWSGQLRGMGYDTLPSVTGRDALQSALDSPRLALVIIDSDTSRPGVREIVYQLRSISKTSHIPVAVVCGGEQLSQFERLVDQDRFLNVTVRPAKDARLAEIVEQLSQLSNSPLAKEEVRMDRAQQALGWLAELLQSKGPHRELRRRGQVAAQTIYQPQLAEASFGVLTHLGTASSQLALLDYASGQTLPVENRRAAAMAFADSADVYGKLLTSSQILEQYDRYNASQSADHDTQQVLGQLLDVLESKDARPTIR